MPPLDIVGNVSCFTKTIKASLTLLDSFRDAELRVKSKAPNGSNLAVELKAKE